MPSISRTVTLFALIAQALAGVSFTNAKIEMYAETPITLTWSDGQEGDVSIRLMAGSSNNYKAFEGLTDTGKDGSFTWTPSKDIPSGTYAFQISDESDDEPNYSAAFTYDKNAEAPEGETTGSKTNSFVTATTSGNSTATTGTSRTTGVANSTNTVTSTTSTSSSSSKTSSSSDPTGTTTNLNGDDNISGGLRSGASSLAALVGLLGAGLFALA